MISEQNLAAQLNDMENQLNQIKTTDLWRLMQEGQDLEWSSFVPVTGVDATKGMVTDKQATAIKLLYRKVNQMINTLRIS